MPTIYVEGHDFCRDNCPYMMLEQSTIEIGFRDEKCKLDGFKCSNANLCATAVHYYKEMQKRNNE